MELENKYDPMDDVPKELEVKGVIGKRIGSARYYSDGSKLRVEYLFDLKELVKADAARLYPLPEKKNCIQCGDEYEVDIDVYRQNGYCGSVCHYIDVREKGESKDET